MKKTYIQPVCKMTYVKLQKMIALSNPTPDNLGQRGGNEVGDNIDASRKYSLWDDDDE